MNKPQPPAIANVTPQELAAARAVLEANDALWRLLRTRLSAQTLDEITNAALGGATLVVSGGVDGLEQTRVQVYIVTAGGKTLPLQSIFVTDMPLPREVEHTP